MVWRVRSVASTSCSPTGNDFNAPTLRKMPRARHQGRTGRRGRRRALRRLRRVPIKASMSVSVEARVPYLDQRVAEIAYRIPKHLLFAQGAEKNVLRRVARRFQLLPEETLACPKLGGSMAVSWLDEQPASRS